jgi:hypothetical protein
MARGEGRGGRRGNNIKINIDKIDKNNTQKGKRKSFVSHSVHVSMGGIGDSSGFPFPFMVAFIP